MVDKKKLRVVVLRCWVAAVLLLRTLIDTVMLCSSY